VVSKLARTPKIASDAGKLLHNGFIERQNVNALAKLPEAVFLSLGIPTMVNAIINFAIRNNAYGKAGWGKGL